MALHMAVVTMTSEDILLRTSIEHAVTRYIEALLNLQQPATSRCAVRPVHGVTHLDVLFERHAVDP